MRFEWDPAKARSNLRKHDVSFDEAVECFSDPMARVVTDPEHHDRFVLLGQARSCRLILTIYAEKDDGETIRIISARKATRGERRQYEEADL